MAAITIDSPRWREGWGEPTTPIRPAPPLRLVDSGCRRPDRGLARRRRLAVAIALALVLLLGFGLASTVLTQPANAGSVPQGRITHLVGPGETYWSIAADHTDHGDLRIAVDRLIDANGARALVPGDRIEIP